MISMTEKQSQLLVFLKQRIAEDNGTCPSYDEMKDALELKSKSGVARLIAAMEERGLIRRLPNRARAIEIVPQSPPERLAEFSTPQLVAELARRSASARAAQSVGASC